jgi:hypothetical protein
VSPDQSRGRSPLPGGRPDAAVRRVLAIVARTFGAIELVAVLPRKRNDGDGDVEPGPQLWPEPAGQPREPR